MMVLGQVPRLAAWVTEYEGNRHLCLLVGPVWFALCGLPVLETEDGPRIPHRCRECLEQSLAEGLVIVPAESVIRV